MSRKIEFELNDLLSLLLCSEYYEFSHGILYQTIAEHIRTLSDQEIDVFVSNNTKSQEGDEYTQTELDSIRDYLYTIRQEYL